MTEEGRSKPLREAGEARKKRTVLLVLVALFGIFFLCAALMSSQPTAEPIATYRVKKHELIQRELEADSASTLPLTIEDPTDRILGAVILVDKSAWYFKGDAKIEDYPEDAAEKFGQLVQTLKFEKPAKPSWELTDDWIEKPGSSSMRAADLVLGEVTFSVIKLPNTGPTDRQYLLENVNRWRNQLSLGPIGSAQLATLCEKVSTADGKSATVVDILGKKDNSAMPPMMRGGGMARGPFQGGGGTPKRSEPADQPKATKPSLASKPPESWEPIETRMFQLERYAVKSGDASGFVSISQAGGNVMMNVNRWRGQVGLDAIESADDVNAEAVKVDGTDGLLIRLLGDKDGIMVAMVPDMKQGRNWFFKLEGPTSLVEKEADAFLDYLETVKLN